MLLREEGNKGEWNLWVCQSVAGEEAEPHVWWWSGDWKEDWIFTAWGKDETLDLSNVVAELMYAGWEKDALKEEGRGFLCHLSKKSVVFCLAIYAVHPRRMGSL